MRVDTPYLPTSWRKILPAALLTGGFSFAVERAITSAGVLLARLHALPGCCPVALFSPSFPPHLRGRVVRPCRRVRVEPFHHEGSLTHQAVGAVAGAVVHPAPRPGVSVWTCIGDRAGLTSGSLTPKESSQTTAGPWPVATRKGRCPIPSRAPQHPRTCRSVSEPQRQDWTLCRLSR